VSVFSGIAVCIPLVVRLVQYVLRAAGENNWSGLLRLVLRLMEEAENQFESGAERREWVASLAETAAESLGCSLERESLEGLIDALCEMSKRVNAGEAET